MDTNEKLSTIMIFSTGCSDAIKGMMKGGGTREEQIQTDVKVYLKSHIWEQDIRTFSAYEPIPSLAESFRFQE